MTESSTIHLPTVCPEWCALRSPEALQDHQAGVLVTDDGRLQVYVDHETSWPLNDDEAILINVALFDDGHHEYSVSLDRVVDDLGDVDEMRKVAAAISAAADFIDGLESVDPAE